MFSIGGGGGDKYKGTDEKMNNHHERKELFQIRNQNRESILCSDFMLIHLL